MWIVMTNGNNFIGTSYLWILSFSHINEYHSTVTYRMEYTVVMGSGLVMLRKDNSQSTEKPALELSCILLFRQRKEVLSYTTHTHYTLGKHFFKIRRSYNSCKMKHIIVRLTQIRLKKCWQCVCTHAKAQKWTKVQHGLTALQLCCGNSNILVNLPSNQLNHYWPISILQAKEQDKASQTIIV